jgi:hypothetical protein
MSFDSFEIIKRACHFLKASYKFTIDSLMALQTPPQSFFVFQTSLKTIFMQMIHQISFPSSRKPSNSTHMASPQRFPRTTSSSISFACCEFPRRHHFISTAAALNITQITFVTCQFKSIQFVNFYCTLAVVKVCTHTTSKSANPGVFSRLFLSVSVQIP